MNPPDDPLMRKARELVLQHLPGQGVFLIVVQKDGSISTTNNFNNDAARLQLLRDVLIREMELQGFGPHDLPPQAAN